MDKCVEAMLFGALFKKLVEERIQFIRDEYDLRKADVLVLYYLSNCGENDTSADVADRLTMNRGHVSQSVDRLRKKNIITLVTKEDDRRYTHLIVTDTGKKIVNDIMEIWKEMMNTVFDGVTEEEGHVLESVSAKIVGNVNAALEDK